MADVVNRDTLEALLARTISRDLRGELSTLMGLLGDPPSVYNVPSSFWENGGGKLRASIEPILRDIYIQQAETALTETSIGVDWGLINESAIDWASQYTFDLVNGITDTSRRLLRNSIDAYFRNPTTLGDLQNRLLSAFGARRAEMIAVTEVTRAAAEGEQKVVDQIIADNPGMESIDIWMTNRDDITCPICAPRHKQPRGSNWTENPPAHPRCRCWLRHDFRMKQDGVEEQVIEQKPVFTPAKTREEAEQWARDTFGIQNVSYKGMDIRAINDWNNALFDSFNRFPELKNNFDFIGTWQERNKYAKELKTKEMFELYRSKMSSRYTDEQLLEMAKRQANRVVGRTSGDTYAVSYSKGSAKGVFYNTTWKYDDLLKALERDVNKQWHPEGCNTVRSILDHEVGHQIGDLVKIKKNNEVLDKIRYDNKTGVTGDILSRYAKTNFDEYVAEAWAEYLNNPTPREPAMFIGKILESMYAALY